MNKLDLPYLKRLNLNENEIATCEDFNGHENLEFFDLSKNKLKSVKVTQIYNSMIEEEVIISRSFFFIKKILNSKF